MLGLLLVAMVLFVGLASVPLWHTDLYVDAVTGSTTLKTTYLFCLHHTDCDPSALQRRLEKSNIPWTPRWTCATSADHWLLGGASRACGTMPLIGRVQNDLKYYVYGASDAEIAAFVQILQHGTPEQQTAAVETKIEPPADPANLLPL